MRYAAPIQMYPVAECNSEQITGAAVATIVESRAATKRERKRARRMSASWSLEREWVGGVEGVARLVIGSGGVDELASGGSRGERTCASMVRPVAKDFSCAIGSML